MKRMQNVRGSLYPSNKVWHVLALLVVLSVYLFPKDGYAQETTDTMCSASCEPECNGSCEIPLKLYELDEVILIAPNKEIGYQKQSKPLSSIDEYLESSEHVKMIKRGAYAWEPTLNSMASERLSITIDGMRIFGACTDKMDPITSYVDVSNLSEISVESGQEGNEHGNCVGGAIDMKLDTSPFKEDYLKVSLDEGFESNNEQKITGVDVNFAEESFYLDGDVIYRKANNYTDGNGEEVLYSRYEKFNLSVNGGLNLNDEGKVTASFIFDQANDVGYPALPMDVSLARAFIGAIGYEQYNVGIVKNWKSKIYANSITHIMDDSQRPDVPIRMDMPGWSDTFGFYSQAELEHSRHSFLVKVDSYYNRSLAEMTMYPNDSNQADMFMLTWPDVRTWNTGIFVQDAIALEKGNMSLSTRISYHRNWIVDEFGLNSLRIFYPEMEASQHRFLASFGSNYDRTINHFKLAVGVSYGTRAPSVSEGFGFYLFNSSDNHDYIGNPDLKNEQAYEMKARISFQKKSFTASLQGSYFYMPNYIIGEIDESIGTMTIGAEGVKLYRNLDYASIANVSVQSEYLLSKNWTWKGSISYHRGVDDTNRNLPFISPIAYGSSVQFKKNRIFGEVAMDGAGEQVNVSEVFGEDKTEAYTVFSLSIGKTFTVSKNQLYAKAGVENIFDTYYSTYTDWNNIPRMGRNVFVTLSYKII
ncbi:TonB-copper family protein [Luteirhabdus pelagi]|uniref:TonB-dependent receptor n=1 Tax=Luteirhabdus pelagi TaxID=2792783 RepID=UPI00193A9774|nr:TonB-dependent receptor [Luteirhabdus pelagi]